eukprot:scaffold107722_cov26-Tisochrysis_lutea.AAC.2
MMHVRAAALGSCAPSCSHVESCSCGSNTQKSAGGSLEREPNPPCRRLCTPSRAAPLRPKTLLNPTLQLIVGGQLTTITSLNVVATFERPARPVRQALTGTDTLIDLTLGLGHSLKCKRCARAYWRGPATEFGWVREREPKLELKGSLWESARSPASVPSLPPRELARCASSLELGRHPEVGVLEAAHRSGAGHGAPMRRLARPLRGAYLAHRHPWAWAPANPDERDAVARTASPCAPPPMLPTPPGLLHFGFQDPSSSSRCSWRQQLSPPPVGRLVPWRLSVASPWAWPQVSYP